MSIFKGLFRTRDAPQNRTAGSSYSFFMGGSASGKQVNERTSMQMTAVYSCVRILSEAVASLPLNRERFEAVVKEWRAGKITAVEAMKRLDVKPNTFYRRVKEWGL